MSKNTTQHGSSSSSGTTKRVQLEVIVAYLMGIALPVLETARRRMNFDEIQFYVDDYIVGGLLLWAAIAVTRGRRYGNALLIAAWGILCGGLWGSFFGQLLRSEPRDISGYSHTFVASVKGVLYAIALLGLFLSIRRAAQTEKGK